MNDDEKCKGIAYDSVMKMCYMSSTLGETCSTSGTTYCGKFITFIIISDFTYLSTKYAKLGIKSLKLKDS